MHRRKSRFAGLPDWLRRPLIALVLIVVSVAAGAGTAIALSPTPQIACAPGADLLVHPDGTWTCGPAPTGSPSTSPTPSSSPSSSPSPSPTTAPPSPTPSTTAPPSPTPTVSNPGPTPTPSGKLTGCMTRLAECGYPHPGNTGVPAAVTLTPYAGPMNITTAGTVIDGKAIGCGLVVRAANVVIRNSRITGPCFYGVEVPSGNVVIEDSEIDCVNHKGTGVAFRNFVVLRSEVRNCENGFHVGSNTVIADSYITGVVEVDGGHGDGAQGSSGSNIAVLRNTWDLENPITSSLIWDGLTMTNVLVEGNFFSAGAYTVYCPSGSNLVYRGNRFYGPVGGYHLDPHRPAYGFRTNCGATTWTGNYRDDTLAAVG